jgi:carbon storage regulator
MLVLGRKPNERILIGDSVAVTVVRIGPNTVKLGIEAPKEMNIVREELTAAKTQETKHGEGRCTPPSGEATSTQGQSRAESGEEQASPLDGASRLA